MEPEFLTVAAALFIHRNQIATYGGRQGVWDAGLLESAMAQSAASHGGAFLHRDLFEMAAAYLYHRSAHSRGPEGWADILGMIEAYDARVTRNGSPSPFISRDVLRRIATQWARPPRRELLRAAAEDTDRAEPALPTTAPEPRTGGLLGGESRRDRYRRERVARQGRGVRVQGLL